MTRLLEKIYEKNELIITEENIKKTLKDNVLNRNEKLIQLIKLLDILEDNYIISIDGGWGTGKTFYIKQLLYLYEYEDCGSCLEEENKIYIENFRKKYVPIYYNAWENDNHIDVLQSIIYNILETFPKYKSDINTKKQDFKSIIKPCLINIIEKTTFGYITKDILDSISSFEDLSEEIVTVEEKKKCLYEIFDLLTKNDTRILLVIDELDRCKPDYAVKTLETIKHFFDYQKITTIVLTNNNQLSKCIKHFYGEDFNGYEYLNKIYDTVLSLEIENLEDYIVKYLDFQDNGYLSEKVFYSIIKYLGFSLRECNSLKSMYEVSAKYINLSYGLSSEEYLIPSNIFLVIGLALKIQNIEEYNEYIKGNADNFIKNFFNFFTDFQNDSENTTWLLRIFNVANKELLITKILEKYHETFMRVNNIHKYPILDALSLLGKLSNYTESKDNIKN